MGNPTTLRTQRAVEKFRNSSRDFRIKRPTVVVAFSQHSLPCQNSQASVLRNLQHLSLFELVHFQINCCWRAGTTRELSERPWKWKLAMNWLDFLAVVVCCEFDRNGDDWSWIDFRFSRLKEFRGSEARLYRLYDQLQTTGARAGHAKSRVNNQFSAIKRTQFSLTPRNRLFSRFDENLELLNSSRDIRLKLIWCIILTFNALSAA